MTVIGGVRQDLVNIHSQGDTLRTDWRESTTFRQREVEFTKDFGDIHRRWTVTDVRKHDYGRIWEGMSGLTCYCVGDRVALHIVIISC